MRISTVLRIISMLLGIAVIVELLGILGIYSEIVLNSFQLFIATGIISFLFWVTIVVIEKKGL